MFKKAFAMAAVAAGIVSGAPSADASLYWTPWVSEENGSPWTYCTRWDEGAVGFGCNGPYCDDVTLLCETFPNGMELDRDTRWIVRWFSEEGGGGPIQSTGPSANQAQCRMHVPGTIDAWSPGVISGVHCRGPYCDDLQVECEAVIKMNGSTPVRANLGSCHDVGPYSEENGLQDFGANQYIYSITCNGAYCDNKTFRVCTHNAPF
jgi:hypothetical protein